MELTDIDGIGPATEEDLRKAGVEAPDDLADADLDTLSDEAGVGQGRLEDFREQIRQAEAAGAPDEGDDEVSLDEPAGQAQDDEEAEADEDDVSLDEPAGEAVTETSEAEPEEEEEDDELKVVLREGQGTASVKVGPDWHDDIPILTATAEEDGSRKLQQVSEDAVLLQERADTGSVRVGDVTYEEVPLVRRREKDTGVVEETRVQVDAVREKDEESGLLDRVRGIFG